MNAIDRYRRRREKRLSERYRTEENAGKRTKLFLAILAVRYDEKTRNYDKKLAKSYQMWYNKNRKSARMDDGEQDEDIDWITLKNGAHIPLKDGEAVGGPVEGETFSHAKSEPSGSSNPGSKKISNPNKKTSPKKKASSKSTGEKSNSKKASSSTASTPENGSTESNNKPPERKRLAVDTEESRELYERIQRGDLLTQEEMAASPVMKQLDDKAAEYDARIGKTCKINTPERQQLRNDIRDDFLKMGSAVKKEDGSYEFTGEIKRNFEAEIVIGLPASGKSTTIANPDSEAMGAFIFDSDEIKTRIPEFRDSGGAAANAVHQESSNILQDAFSAFLQGGARNGDNLVIPVIGDDYDYLCERWLEPLAKAGYNIKIKYKDTDPTESLNRNTARAIETGRIIPSWLSLSYENKPKEVYERFEREGRYV